VANTNAKEVYRLAKYTSSPRYKPPGKPLPLSPRFGGPPLGHISPRSPRAHAGLKLNPLQELLRDKLNPIGSRPQWAPDGAYLGERMDEATTAGYLGALKSVIQSRFKDMENAFRYVDVDGSGTITRRELEKALHLWGVIGPEGMDASIDAVIRACDANGDGTIEYQEFVDALTQDKCVPHQEMRLLKRCTCAACAHESPRPTARSAFATPHPGMWSSSIRSTVPPQ
jgi:hypothetical protein